MKMALCIHAAYIQKLTGVWMTQQKSKIQLSSATNADAVQVKEVQNLKVFHTSRPSMMKESKLQFQLDSLTFFIPSQLPRAPRSRGFNVTKHFSSKAPHLVLHVENVKRATAHCHVTKSKNNVMELAKFGTTENKNTSSAAFFLGGDRKAGGNF